MTSLPRLYLVGSAVVPGCCASTRSGKKTLISGVLKISLAGANNLVPTTGLTPCVIIIHVYTCNYSGAGKNIDAR